MRYQIAPLFCRPWTINGMTPRLIESHYENNYGGAFTRLNTIAEELAALGVDPMPMTPCEFAKLVEREIEANAELVKAAGIKPQ